MGISHAVILAGGKGTRLAPLLPDLPKPMAPIGGKPVIEHQVELLRKHGISDLTFFLGHGAEKIAEHFGDGSRWGVRIRFVFEDQPLGSAGCVVAGLGDLPARFFVLYGDTMLNVYLPLMAAHHLGSGAAATLFLHPNDHPADSDLVETDDMGRVVAFHPYPHSPDKTLPNLVNAALYVVERDALQPFRGGGKLDFGKDIFPALLASGSALSAYVSREYIKDMGTPGRYEKVCKHYEEGRIGRGSLETPVRAVFLDRDGTLIRDVNHLSRPDQVELLPGAGEALRQINGAGLLAVLVTNQPVIARGDLSFDGLRQVHNTLETLLGSEGAFLDRIYFCPHHPDRGFPGERSELKFSCDCRKPAPGMILQAARELNIDLAGSFMVGDSWRDVEAGRAAGVCTILLSEPGQGDASRGQPDHIASSLSDAIRYLAVR